MDTGVSPKDPKTPRLMRFPDNPLPRLAVLVLLCLCTRFLLTVVHAAPGAVLFQSDFRGQGINGIAPFTGKWEVAGGELRQTTAEWDVSAALDAVSLPKDRPFALEITARPLDAFFGAGV